MTPEIVLLWLLIGVIVLVNTVAVGVAVLLVFLGLPNVETGKELARGGLTLLGLIFIWYATAKLLQWLLPLASA